MDRLIERWIRPDHYFGADWPEWFVFLGQHRDSDTLTRSNFTRGLELIGGESDTVQVIRENHWAVGWVEWIAIHESDEAALDTANEILSGLFNYPVIDDEHFSNLEHDEAADSWERMRIKDRISLCADAGISIFAARRDCLPDDPQGRLIERLTAN